MGFIARRRDRAETPTWAARGQTDVDLVGGSSNLVNGSWSVVLEYTVPAGKTLFIYDWSVGMSSVDQGLTAVMLDGTTAKDLSYCGGRRGFAVVFNKPKRLTAGKLLRISVIQQSGSVQTAYATAGCVLA